MKIPIHFALAFTTFSVHADILFTEDFTEGDGGFISTEVGGSTFPWIFNAPSSSWRLDGDSELNLPTRNNLTSPGIAITGDEIVEIRFDHRYSIEGDLWDGGALFVSINGGGFVQIPGTSFFANGYNAIGLIGNHDLLGGEGFGGDSPGYQDGTFITSVAQIRGLSGGDTIQLQFVGAYDELYRGDFLPNWEIDSVTVESLLDDDDDGMPNRYELAHGLNPEVNDAGDDPDMDNSSNLMEFENRTNPQDDDSDNDNLKDGVETNTGIFVNAGNTGTDPLNSDSDGDGLKDDVETGTGIFIDASNTGSNPNRVDTDLDGTNDAQEVVDGTNPSDPRDFLRILAVDFNSTNLNGGPNSVGGAYRDYNAGHEVASDFVTQSYMALGAMVSVTPSWPDTGDNRVRQMVDRGAFNDDNWIGKDLELVTDWLGIDTRTGSGGNGDYDGITGTPTTMLLTLGGLPGGTYRWTSFHHDTEKVHAPFLMAVSTDGGAVFDLVEGDLKMSSSTAGANPTNFVLEFGPDPASLSSTVVTEFETTGVSDVVIRFIPLSHTAAHTQIFGINGFILEQTSPLFSPFQITEITRNPGNGDVILTWNSKAERTYTIRASESLDSDPSTWADLEDNWSTQGESTSYTDPNPGQLRRFYVVEENP